MLKRVWMKVTRDEFALPLAVANTAYELSKVTGESIETIKTNARRWRLGEQKYPHFIAVEIDVDDAKNE